MYDRFRAAWRERQKSGRALFVPEEKNIVYSFKAAARKICCHESKLQRLIRDGYLDTVRMGRRHAVSGQSLSVFLRERDAGIPGVGKKGLLRATQIIDKLARQAEQRKRELRAQYDEWVGENVREYELKIETLQDDKAELVCLRQLAQIKCSGEPCLVGKIAALGISLRPGVDEIYNAPADVRRFHRYIDSGLGVVARLRFEIKNLLREITVTKGENLDLRIANGNLISEIKELQETNEYLRKQTEDLCRELQKPQSKDKK